ncbi:FAD-dependent oxidoreductase [Desulfovibrio aminophilus]|uniref:FAD-dependent oxidoreductase n=1 Tax=Desulfovibrio aminophilus TaxID=81425 RepID=UPI00339319E2
MARIIYGVWDSRVHDNRGKGLFEIPESVELAEFDAFNQGNPIKAFVGDRGFFVFAPDTSLLDALFRHLAAAAVESCGKCTPCRVGLHLIQEKLAALRDGKGGPELLDETAELARLAGSTSRCNLGRSSAVALLAAVEHFRDVLEAEILAAPLPVQPGQSYTTAPCVEACPAKVNVPRYIDYIKDGKPSHSLGVILQKYPMAATCGRVCVRFCEQACRRGLVDEPVGIKTLKRYVADHEHHLSEHWFTRDLIEEEKPSHLRVAVVGAGPAGISCAYHLLLKGYPVDVLEARDEAGGMAACGIPSYRLPKSVLKSEVRIVADLGGRIFYNRRMGRDFTLDDLFAQGYKAVFLALGCSTGRPLGVKGEHCSEGCRSGVDFLLDVHDHVEGQRPMSLTGKTVVAVGGGNVAMDCVRSALRLGAKAVHLVYRRGREDMPADHEEVEAAEQEGVTFHFLSNPTRILSEDERVIGVELIEMRPVETDGRGRRGVDPVPGTERVLPCDLLISAVGQQMDSASVSPGDGVVIDKRGCLETDPMTLATARQGVFAGGDCVLGPSTLIHAMANGLKASRAIDDYLTYGRVRFFARSRMRKLINDFMVRSKEWTDAPVKHLYRIRGQELDPAERRELFEEVERPIGQEEAYREAGRCLRCYRIYSLVTESPIPKGSY